MNPKLMRQLYQPRIVSRRNRLLQRFRRNLAVAFRTRPGLLTNVYNVVLHKILRENTGVTLNFLREDVPRNWPQMCDSVTGNFHVINPSDFRVLE